MLYKTQTLAFILLVFFQPSSSFRKKTTAQQLARTDSQLETPEGYLPICAKEIIKETCSLMHGGFTKQTADNAMQWLPIDTIKAVLAAHEDSMAALWKALGVPPMPSGAALKVVSDEVKSKLAEYGLKISKDGEEHVLNVACEEVCYRVRDFVKEKYHLPPASDLQCRVENDEIKCDIDVRPEALAKLHKAGDMPDLHEGDIKQPDPKALSENLPENTSIFKEPMDRSVIDYATWEIVENVAGLFRFYPLLDKNNEPVPPVSLLQLGAGGQGYDQGQAVYNHGQAVILGKKAIAYVTNVKRQLELPGTKPHLKEWFGIDSTATKTEIVRVLNSLTHVLKNVHYEYPGPQCSSGTYAYVYPRGLSCNTDYQVKSTYCRLNPQGKFIYYLCNVYVNSDDGGKIETLVHEGSHHSTAYTDDVCADRSHIYGVSSMDNCQQKAYGRSTCVNLATYDKPRALKNADSHCYFVQAIADPEYHEKQRCKASSNALTPFGDDEGDCKCPSGRDCYQGSQRGCTFSSGGKSYEWFRSSCTNCRCGGPGGPGTYPTIPSTSTRCHSSAAQSEPDSDGECKCPSNLYCYTGNSRGCRSSVSSSGTTYFVATCSNCQCKSGSGVSPRPPASGSCPATALRSSVDTDGDCECKSGEKCYNNGVPGVCPYSRGTSGTWFSPSCTTCTCRTEGSGPPAQLAGQCPSFAEGTTPDNRGDCKCPSGGYLCFQFGSVSCMASGGGWSRKFFSSSCVTCECKIPSVAGLDIPDGDDDEDDRDNGVGTWSSPLLAILVSTLLARW